MEKPPGFNPRSPDQAGLNVPNKEKFLADLAELLKENKGSELIGTFQAGCIPVILDTLARDTSDKGQKIVISVYKMINDLKIYYMDREKEDKEEVVIPVKMPDTPVKPSEL